MRKILAITICLFIILINNTLAQNKVRIGFKFDPSLSWTITAGDKPLSSDGGRFSFNYGVMLDYEFSKNYFFSTGLGICNTGGYLQGAGADNNGHALNYSSTYKLQYIELPFALKLRTENRSIIKYWGSFGGYLGIPIKASQDENYQYPNYSQYNHSSSDQDVYSNIVFLNVGMELAAGIEYSLNRKNVLIVGLDFKNGLTDITKEIIVNDGKLNLNSFGFKIGMFF